MAPVTRRLWRDLPSVSLVRSTNRQSYREGIALLQELHDTLETTAQQLVIAQAWEQLHTEFKAKRNVIEWLNEVFAQRVVQADGVSMEETNTKDKDGRMIAALPHTEKVLAYWHKIEFFASTDLKGFEAEGDGVIRYRGDELGKVVDCLPWLNREQIRRAGTGYRPESPYRFKLYLGVFKRQDIFEVARKVYPELQEAWAERSRDDGLTCSFTVLVDEYGRIDRDSFEVSTAPWVMGTLQQDRLDGASRKAFDKATAIFRERLETLLTVADNLKQEHDLPPMLTTFELIEMLKAMSEWTAFQPLDDNVPVLVVRLSKVNLKGEASNAKWEEHKQRSIPPRSWQSLAVARPTLDVPEGHEQTLPGEEPAPDAENIDEMAIFNSFFIDDLERVMAHIRAKGLRDGSPLACYLRGRCDRKADLLTSAGQALMKEHLAVLRMPLGRWPGEDKHSMSLMQQFAINVIDGNLDETGLYSVNGPPGTGKTTMLRDLVARNIVKRAEVLASLNSVDAAFGGDIKVSVNGELKTIKTLIPELTGYEMLVVSSNNAAVENITKELPQCKALGEAYKDLTYLKPVARKLAAKHDNFDGGATLVSPLAPQDDCWGLIATALGNSANRNRFGQCVFIKKIGDCRTVDDAVNYRTLAPALKERAQGRDTTKDFKRAQREFKAAKAKVERILEELEKLQALKRLTDELRSLQEAYDTCRTERARLALWLSKRRARRVAPWLIKRFLRHRAILKGLNARQDRAAKAAELNRQRAEALERRLEQERRECVVLDQRYQDALLPDDALDLERPDVQRTSFGHCKVLNQARAEVTARAFELHESWLTAAYQQKLLGNTMFSLMPAINGRINDRDAAKALWQMLFMIVPVISSTFASVGSQFHALREGELGWLFVDEAGQASPQQAVGALWRAKRAVVVGDPLQIEPVFTVPPSLAEAMAKGEFGAEWYKWSPTVASVQLVADQANPYGTTLIADDLWVGSPLRVHRRCQEPMFSLANGIAYNGKMIHGDEDLSPGPGDSRWLDSTGALEGRHFVPAQAERVAQMLKSHIERNSSPPNVYIISPFKAVAHGVKNELARSLPEAPFGGRKALNEWLQIRVGTVHTFQGKEEENVILVLGLSEASPGAAEWASSKPNLLNVALTRAKTRFYVVGSTCIWANKKYFSDVSRELSGGGPDTIERTA